ncbi:MAG: sulfite exporter TauE/SafE family protein [Thermodesulfobacteriota bacterium]
MSDLSQLSEVISRWSYLSVPVGVFIASLAGSSHCAVMCGPLAVTVHSRLGYLPLYHLGRLASYLSLGVLAGLLGEKFLSSNYPFISRVSLILLSLFLIYAGYNIARGKHLELVPGRLVTSLLTVPARFALTQKKPLASLTLGLVNGFVPCGWVYIFVIGAVAVKNPLYGGLMLFIFWLGTIPALSFFPIIYKKSISIAPRKVALIAGMMLISAGLANFAIHMIPSREIDRGSSICAAGGGESGSGYPGESK